MIPCIDCVTFSICNSYLSPIVDVTQRGVIFKLYDRCAIMRDFLNISRENKCIDELGIEYEELDIDYDKLKEVHTYFKQFKRRKDG